MFKYLTIIFTPLFFFIGSSTQGQTWEIGASVGVSYYVGDLNPTYHFRFPRPAASVFGKYNFHRHWAARAGFSYMGVAANDNVGIYGFQTVRNLNFKSDIFELHAAIEFNFLPFRPGGEDRESKKWTPYIFAGVGGFYFNPKTQVNVKLEELHTEGQFTESGPQRSYSRIQPSIPFGLGFKFVITRRFSMGIEYGMRLTFTDYLDDVHNVYGDAGEILALGGPVALENADKSISPFTNIPNTHYQRGSRWDNDWFGYLGVLFIFNIKDPSLCTGVGGKAWKWQKVNTKKRR